MDVRFSSGPLPELAAEIAIRWVCDPREYRYVRQAFIDVSGNRGKPVNSPLVLGWAVVRPDGRRGGYRRRMFYLQASDLASIYDDCRPPGDCVDPCTVEVGVGGQPPRPDGGLFASSRPRRPRPPAPPIVSPSMTWTSSSTGATT